MHEKRKKNVEIKCKEAEVIICMVFFFFFFFRVYVREYIDSKWDIRHIKVIVKEEYKKNQQFEELHWNLSKPQALDALAIDVHVHVVCS